MAWVLKNESGFELTFVGSTLVLLECVSSLDEFYVDSKCIV